MTTWVTSPLAESGGATHWVADLTTTDDDGTHRALCDPLLVMPDARPARAPHGYCVGCLALTAESPDWCVTDLQILRQAATAWVLPRLIMRPDDLARSLPAQGAGARATGYGSSFEWCRDGLRVWAGKRPGALLVDKVPPTRVLTWAAIAAHAAAHTTEEQRWWLAELEGWQRHWSGLSVRPDRDLKSAQQSSRRQQAAIRMQYTVAAPTWADDTLALGPTFTPMPESRQPNLLDLLKGVSA